MVTKGDSGGRDNLGDWDWDIQTLYKIDNDLLYTTGNSTQYSVIYIGKGSKRGDKYTHTYKWLFTLLCSRNQQSIVNQVSSVAQLCPTLCDPMNCSTPGFPVHHQLPELAQTHVHWVGNAIQSSHPLSSPSPPAFNLFHHQGLFHWVSSHQVAKVLEFQHQSFQWIFRTDFLQDGLVGSPCSPRDSQESSPTPQFKSINSSALS